MRKLADPGTEEYPTLEVVAVSDPARLRPYRVELSPDETADELRARIDDIVQDGWEIIGYDGFHGAFDDYEWPVDLNLIQAVAAYIMNHPHYGEAMAVFINNRSDTDPGTVAESFEDSYAGEAESLVHWARDFKEDTGFFEGIVSPHLREQVRMYFDYDSWVRDAILGGSIWSHESGFRRVHVFWVRY